MQFHFRINLGCKTEFGNSRDFNIKCATSPSESKDEDFVNFCGDFGYSGHSYLCISMELFQIWN